MQITEAVKNLAVAMGGAEKATDITTDQIAETIQYIVDNWETISAGLGGSTAVTVDTLSGATETGKAVMKAANAAAARTAIGAGTQYTLPAATTSTLGGVKEAATVAAVSVADASTAIAAEYAQAEVQAIATLTNANKAAINSIITNLKTAGIMA